MPLLIGWPKPKARERARELMDLVGLDAQMARRYPYQLSGGQQQRVGVARALAADPPVLLMDEPFSAVDPIVRASLQDELLRLQAELRKTVVFVTHDIEEAIKVGDQVAIFRPGGAPGAGGHARSGCWPRPPTATSRTSSASTAASAGCPSSPPSTLDLDTGAIAGQDSPAAAALAKARAGRRALASGR